MVEVVADRVVSSLNARISVDAQRALNRYCNAEGKKKAWVVERAIINYLVENDPDFEAHGAL